MINNDAFFHGSFGEDYFGVGIGLLGGKLDGKFMPRVAVKLELKFGMKRINTFSIHLQNIAR